MKDLRYINFFNRYTIIRRWQCSIFGHNPRCIITTKKKGKWCTWCARRVKEGE